MNLQSNRSMFYAYTTDACFDVAGKHTTVARYKFKGRLNLQ